LSKRFKAIIHRALMKCGIVGLPNVGKSTLFNCLSNAVAQSANYPFCTIEPNLGTINVPDPRLNALEKIVNPERVVPATVEIVDIAGLVRGASKGEGLGNQFLSHIRETHAILHVLRCFEDDNITHVDGNVDPIRDKETIETELHLKDLETVEKHMDKWGKQRKSGDKVAQAAVDVLERYKNTLLNGQSARSVEVTETEYEEVVRDMHLLTQKPVLYVCNVDDDTLINGGNAWVEKVREMAGQEGAEVLMISAQTESEINQLETYEERSMFLEDLGLKEPGVNDLIRRAYNLLKLQTYFTAGVKEVRAWTIGVGFTAPQAAGVIHTDFQKGFIRAEVIKFDDYVALGSESACRDAGKMSVEGKEYVVKDGDIMHFRFNV